MFSTKRQRKGAPGKKNDFSLKFQIFSNFKITYKFLEKDWRGIPYYAAGCAALNKSLLFFLSVLLLCSFNTPAWGAGFTLYQQGTAAMAQGNAFVAEANDPSAIFYNPAGINQLQRPEIYLATFVNYPDREFRGPGGEFSQTKPLFYPAGAVYITYPFNEHVAGGLGLFVPFGLGSDWPSDWDGRYITTFSRLRTYNLNPVISIKFNDRFSLAGGFNVLWSSVELRKHVPLAVGPFQLPDGKTCLKGSGTGFGFNCGALLKVMEGVKLGVSYRSHVEVNFHGDLDLRLPSLVPGPRSVSGSAKLVFPPFVTMGISVSRFPPFTVNFDATWTGWSTYDELRVNLAQPIVVNGVLTDTLVQPKNWHDTWTFRFGANYQLKKNIKLRAGYTYDLSPVPDETFDPQIPNANQHIFTVGGTWQIKRFTLGIAYNYILVEGRSKNNLIPINDVPLPNQANGKYETDVHSLGLSCSYQF
jgi:long-chain fatty acid transport protein